MMFFSFLIAGILFLQTCFSGFATSDPLARAKEMVAQMTLSEKFVLMFVEPLISLYFDFIFDFSFRAGCKGEYVGNTKAIDRLGIPALRMQDGPQGFRATDRAGGPGTSTAWPSALTIAASWDRDLVYRWASAMGKEFKDKGKSPLSLFVFANLLSFFVFSSPPSSKVRICI